MQQTAKGGGATGVYQALVHTNMPPGGPLNVLYQNDPSEQKAVRDCDVITKRFLDKQ